MASLGESKMTQTGVFWGLLENDDSNRKTERWYLSLEFETNFSSKTDWFGDLNIFQKLGSNFEGTVIVPIKRPLIKRHIAQKMKWPYVS